jgi:two-component system LytT family response regulator
MIKAVIIDDEKKSRETLRGLIQTFCNDITILAEADGFINGIEIIKKHNPEVVFLDIQMPDGSGFRLLESIKNITFDVIFTTAYDQFAIKAIRYSALDYLLKPIVPEELQNAVEKVKQNRKKGNLKSNIEVLLENVSSGSNDPKKIVLSTSEGMHIVKVCDIIRCESDDYYTKFFLVDGKKIMVSKTLKENEQLLSEHNFIRPHKSHLVNINYIKSYIKTDGGYLVLTNDFKVPVSRRKKEKILEIINQL